MSDPHIGAITQQMKFLKFAVDYIKNGRNRYWIYVGDAMENNLSDSVGSPLQQTMTPKAQLRKTVELFEPIVDKCIAFNTWSNHGARTTKKTSLNPDELIAEKLGLPFTFPTDEAHIRVGNRIYDIIHSHGSSGATTLGGKVNAMMKYPAHYDGDIYIIGHLHTILYWKQWKIKHNKYREMNFVIGGSFLDYFNSYGQVKNYSPTPAQFVSVVINESEDISFKHFVNLMPEINMDV